MALKHIGSIQKNAQDPLNPFDPYKYIINSF